MLRFENRKAARTHRVVLATEYVIVTLLPTFDRSNALLQILLSASHSLGMSDSEGTLVDTTVPIPLRSRRTIRIEKKVRKKAKKHVASDEPKALLDLPSEILVEILGYLQPSDVFKTLRVNRALHSLIICNERAIVRNLIGRRYSVLARCFPLPLPFEKVDIDARAALLNEKRQELLNIHRKPYQHIKSPEPLVICTCLTCVLAWNNLCLLVDFAHWQNNLDQGEPIPMIPRGRNPPWNQSLVTANGIVVEKAMERHLWYARILEQHLDSTTRAIKRLSIARKKEPPFQTSIKDVELETDAFTQRHGPPSYEFPYHRDNYYMLESYLPNRRWDKEKQTWLYYPDSQHERDLEWVKRQTIRQEELKREITWNGKILRTEVHA